MARRNWQRDELLLALNLYCRLPFGQYHSGNSQIIELAQFIDRTPDAVAMKLANFASLDPYHQKRGVIGLQNASRADREIWDEFNSNWNELAAESETAYSQLTGLISDQPISETYEEEVLTFSTTTEVERQVKVRVGQRFFRKVILTSYGHKCCVCGIPIPGLLIASHIVPWRDAENLRVNPHNGLCLCTLHDRGFDRGFFTLGEKYQVMLGSVLQAHIAEFAVHNGFGVYEGREITLPDKFIPDQEYLAVHRNKHFLG